LGGLITGIFAGIAISEFFDQEARNKDRHPDRFTEQEYKERGCCCNSFCCNWCGTIGLILWLGTLLVLFYTVVDVDQEQADIDSDDP
jgi:hypothetical protein